MPIYEYLCKNCGILEILQKISDKTLSKCPQCKLHITKKISTVGRPRFKGSGFYETDYAKKSNK